jgi:hypothetical protein
LIDFEGLHVHGLLFSGAEMPEDGDAGENLLGRT